MTDDLRMLDELEALEKKATPGPWGWTNHGEKSNNAVLGIWYSRTGEQMGGCITEEVYDEAAGDYKRLADFDDSIAYKEDNANYTDFALCAAARNALPTLLRLARRGVEAGKALEAAQTHLKMSGLVVSTADKRTLRLIDSALGFVEKESANDAERVD